MIGLPMQGIVITVMSVNSVLIILVIQRICLGADW